MAVREPDVGFGRLQRIGGDAGALDDDLVRRTPDRGPAHIGRPRAAVAAAQRDPVGVALDEPDALVRDTEAVGEDLREGRLVALPDGLRAGDQ